jgi:protein-L-isoaspartate O-methyltransferase
MRRATTDEERTIERFRPRYGRARVNADRAVERAAIGANVGANGYTTIAQADRMTRLLQLGPGMRLLDVGCGRGYPGLYMAAASRCSVVVPTCRPPACERAQRAARQRLRRRAASWHKRVALAVPCRELDAIVHADVLC